jgi:hypothetical protein
MAGLGPRPVKQRRYLSRLLYGLSLILLGFGLVNIGWAVWPVGRETRSFIVPAGILPGAPAGESYASLAAYELRVSWPRWIRAGETGDLSMSLSEEDLFEARTPEVRLVEGEAQVILIEPTIFNLTVEPPGRAQITLGSGQALQQTWALRGDIAGEYPGKLLVSFGFYDEALDELVPVPVAVVDMVLRVVTLWGLARGLAVWLGIVGVVMGGALFVLGRMMAA